MIKAKKNKGFIAGALLLLAVMSVVTSVYASNNTTRRVIDATLTFSGNAIARGETAVSHSATHGVVAVGARASVSTGAASNWHTRQNANGSNLAGGNFSRCAGATASRRNNVTLTGHHHYMRRGDTNWRPLNDTSLRRP